MKQGTGIRDQGSGAVENLLRSSIRPIGEGAEPPHDLWPAMQARLRSDSGPVALRAVPWFDWALAAGLALFALAFPAAVPMILYYL